MRVGPTTEVRRPVLAALLLFCALFCAGTPGVVGAQEARPQLEVTGPEAGPAGVALTVVTSAGLAGRPTVSVAGTARSAEVTPGLRPAVVLVVESSSSMSAEQMAAVRQAAGAFLNQLPASVRVAVVTFDGTIRTEGFAAAGAGSALDNLVPSGGSALFDAIGTAAARLRDQERASASLVIITHGWDWGNASKSTRDDSYGAVQALGAEVYPVVVGSEFDTSLTSRLAKPVRAAPWRLDDLAGGAVAAALVAGARLEQRVMVDTAGLAIGEHQLSVGWDGPSVVAPVVRTVALTASSGAGAGAGAVAVGGTPQTGTDAPAAERSPWDQGAIPVVVLGAVGALWFVRWCRRVVAAKVAGRLDVSGALRLGARGVALSPAANGAAVEASTVRVPRDPSEQRAFDRVRLDVPAKLSLSGGTGASQQVIAFDISEGGLSFRAHTPISAGSHGYLSMALPPDGDEVQLHLLVLNVVPVDTDTYSAHCSFIDITPRTLWQIVGACMALSGEATNRAELMDWGRRHSATVEQLESDPLSEPVVADPAEVGRTLPPAVAVIAVDDTADAVLPAERLSFARFSWEEDGAAGDQVAVSVAGLEVAAADAEVPAWQAADEASDGFANDDAVASASAALPLAAAEAPSTFDAFEFVPASEPVSAGEFADEVDAGEPFGAVVESEGTDWATGGHVVMDPEAERETVEWVADPIEEVRVDERETFEAVASEAVNEPGPVDAGIDGSAATGDDRAANVAAPLAFRLGEQPVADGFAEPVGFASPAESDGPAAASQAEHDPDPEIRGGGPSLVAQGTGATQVSVVQSSGANDEVRCSHCDGGVLELQRLVRQDDYLESWWLCLACSRIAYRQQEPGVWLRTTSVPDANDAPPARVAATDFGTIVLRMRQEEAAAVARATQLRAELARTEGVLHDIRTLHRLLERFGVDAPTPVRAEDESRAA